MAKQPQVVVEWVSPPEGWMVPACVAFEECLRRSLPQDHESSQTDPLVVRVNYFHESARCSYLTKAGMLAQEDDGTTSSRLLAQHPIRIASKRPVLNTSLVRALSRHNLQYKAFLCAAAGAFVVASIDPGVALVDVRDPAKSNGTITYWKSNVYTLWVKATLLLVAWFLALHHISAAIVRICCESFDVWVLVLMKACEVSGLMYESLLIRFSLGEAESSVLQVCAVVAYYLSTMVVALYVAFADALDLPLIRRALPVLLFFANSVYQYMYFKFMHKWSTTGACLLASCLSLQDFVTTAEFHLILFSFKLLVHYIRGKEFVVLTTAITSTSQPVPLEQRLTKSAMKIFSHQKSRLQNIIRSTRLSCDEELVSKISWIAPFEPDNNVADTPGTKMDTSSTKLSL